MSLHLVKTLEHARQIASGDADAIVLDAQHGLAVGISSGANVIGALRVQQQLGGGAVVVTVIADSNKKYLSTDLLRREPVRPEYESAHVAVLGYAAFSRTCAFCVR